MQQITTTHQLLNYKDYRPFSPHFWETGSAAGDGIQRALDAGFETVTSIEAQRAWYDVCQDKFTGDDRVILMFGKSTDMMLSTEALAQRPFVVFLDAHSAGPASFGHTEALAGTYTQDDIIKAELAILMDSGQRHLIIIDDVNGLADGHAVEYCGMLGDGYEYYFFNENLSGNLLYTDKILVCVPKIE